MATEYPEYDAVGLIDGFKTLTSLQEELTKLEADIKRGYRDLTEAEAKQQGLPHPYRLQLAQFSQQSTDALAKQKDLVARQVALSSVLEAKAKKWTPLSGPDLPMQKEERRIVGVLLGAPAAATSVTPATPRVLTAAESKALATGRTLPASTAVDTATTDTTVVSKQSAVNQKAYVDAQLKAKGLADTPANRKTLRAAYQALTPEEKVAAVPAVPGANAPAGDMAWMEIFRKDYPAYSDWTTSAVTEHFGQDFMDILNDATLSEEEQKRRLKSTKYFTAASDKQYFFDSQRKGVQDDLVATARRAIITDYADVGLSETDLADLSRTVARSGLTGTGLKQAVYQYAFRRGAAAPAMTDTKMATNVLQGADADAIRQSARAYGYAVSDAEVQAALTGGMYNGVAVSSESILQKAQKAAKGAYGHLSDQIDAGLSLSDIFENYKRYAANVLELDESQIDFTKDPKWQSAFGTKESGQMGLGDWVTKLKSDESFGWQFTKQANQQATDIGLTLARAFGKVK